MARFFADAVAARQLSAPWVLYVSLGYAAILVLMSLLQLFSLEEFVPIIEEYSLPGGTGSATLFACGVIVAQVFSLPYLLRMTISPLLRLVGAVLSVATPLLWLGMAVYALANDYTLANGGILGEKLPVPADGLQITFALGLLVLAAASAYGLFATRAAKK